MERYEVCEILGGREYVVCDVQVEQNQGVVSCDIRKGKSEV